jgi:hypothetical protein
MEETFSVQSVPGPYNDIKYKSLKLGSGKAYDLSSDYAAVIA